MQVWMQTTTHQEKSVTSLPTSPAAPYQTNQLIRSPEEEEEVSSPAHFNQVTNALVYICVVQAFIRGASQRAEFQKKREAALALQSMLFSMDEESRMKLELQERRGAVLKLQKIWRRRRYIKHCTVIQSYLRASQFAAGSAATLADIKQAAAAAAATDNNDAVLADTLGAQDNNNNTNSQDQDQSVADYSSKFNDETSNSSLVKQDLSIGTSSPSVDSSSGNNAEQKRNARPRYPTKQQPVTSKKNKGSRYGDYLSTFDGSNDSSAKTLRATQEPLHLELSSPPDFHKATNALVHICVVQAFIRGVLERAEFQRKRDAALALQSMLYSVDEESRMKLELQERQDAAAKLQKIWRRRRHIKHCKVIQSYFRGSQFAAASVTALADTKKDASTGQDQSVIASSSKVNDENTNSLVVEKQPVTGKKNKGSRYGSLLSTFSSSDFSGKTKKSTLRADAPEFFPSSGVYGAATSLVQVVQQSLSVVEETAVANEDCVKEADVSVSVVDEVQEKVITVENAEVADQPMITDGIHSNQMEDLDRKVAEDTQNNKSEEPSLNEKKEDPSFLELEVTQEEEELKEDDVPYNRIKKDECAYYLMGKCTGGRKKKRQVTWLWKWWNDWWTVELIPRCRFGYHEEDRLYCSICCHVIQDNVHKFHYKRCFDGLAEDDPRRLKLLKMAEEQSK